MCFRRSCLYIGHGDLLLVPLFVTWASVSRVASTITPSGCNDPARCSGQSGDETAKTFKKPRGIRKILRGKLAFWCGNVGIAYSAPEILYRNAAILYRNAAFLHGNAPLLYRTLKFLYSYSET